MTRSGVRHSRCHRRAAAFPHTRHRGHGAARARRTFGLLTAACPQVTALARLTGEFAALLDPARGNNDELTEWITTVPTA